MIRNHCKRRYRGFTLAELLIALAILGVIATFTIPKVLQSQQDGKYKVIAKETASTLAGAYQNVVLNGKLSSSTKTVDLAPYMNYVKVYTGQIDDRPGLGAIDCNSGADVCYLLHNGAVLRFDNTTYFGGTASTNAIPFLLDPDGTYTGAASGQGVNFWVYYTGKITTYCCIDNGTTMSNLGGPQVKVPDPTKDPSWFSWN